MDFFLDWLNLGLRWFHVIAGVAWIGASFYFNWLEGNLERLGKPQHLQGDLWAVHGGGFYQVLKYQGAPETLPKTLHWFKWEAYMTWISGFSLLVLIYYVNSKVYLVDPSKYPLSEFQAISIGVATLVIGWLVYHGLCRTKLCQKPLIFGAILFALLGLVAFGLDQIFNSRGAYIHVGALIGTWMVGNVFFIIIPSQKKMVAAAQKGEDPPDPHQAKHAGLRSLHNNYFTLPLLFIMISQHYPATYQHALPWLILMLLSIAGVLIRQYFNRKNFGFKEPLWLVAGAIVIGMTMGLTIPQSEESQTAATSQVSDIEAAAIIQERCRSCHAAAPADDVFTVTPNGVAFDNMTQIRAQAQSMYNRIMVVKNMPFANKTAMTDEEREALGAWLKQLD